ncbi:unnamed protein product [Paramecium sonneborni]|uniref:Transmembrane protein n=1 Tax=Paramecium sonneborni TaxID=65129 RepID=A0A8S1LW16_9CILI|nr:unnamed protein product [Paramecium sonneborni]
MKIQLINLSVNENNNQLNFSICSRHFDFRIIHLEFTFDNIILFGVINELQNIAQIDMLSSKKLFSTSSDLNFIMILARPNIYFQSSTISSYILFVYQCIFFLCCICLIYIVKARSENLVNELKIAFNTNIYIKLLFIFLHVSIRTIKQGFGYIIIDICFQTIKQNINDIIQVSLSFIIILGIDILILFFTKMFSYNWALDFQRQHLIINESSLIYYRVFIKLLQLSFVFYDQDFQIFRITQTLLPVISSLIQIYQMQKLKQLIYDYYYKVILAINLIIITLCLNHLMYELFSQYQFQEIWILLFIVPFYCFINQIKRHFQEHFINFQNSSIENSNYVLFQIIYNMNRQKDSFNSEIIYLMFLQKHSQSCNNLQCACQKRLQSNNFQQISYQIFFKDLLQQYEKQISTISFKCTQDQIIFSYFQLLFFLKQYLTNISKQYFKNQTELKFKIKFQNQKILTSKKKYLKFIIYINYLYQKQLKIQCDQIFFQNFPLKKIVNYLILKRTMQPLKNFFKQNNKFLKLKKFQFRFCNKKSITWKKFIQISLNNVQKNQLINQYKTKQMDQNSQGFVLNKNQKSQNILMFYHIEILNDIISPQNQNSTTSCKFSNLIVQINNKSSIKILKCSYNQKDKFDKLDVLSLQDMIPNYIQVSHMKLIENFIAGFAMFVQKKIDLLMDLSLLNLTSIEMILFFCKKKDNQFSIFLDDTKRIINIDEELFTDILNIDGVFAQYFIGLEINVIFENFNQLTYDQIYNQQNFYFVDPNKINSSNLIKSQQRNIQSQWNYTESLITYQCNLLLARKKNEFGSNYYEIVLKNPKHKKSKEETFNHQLKQSENLIPFTPYDESIIVDKPFVIDQSLHNEKLYSQQFVLKSEIVYQNIIQSDIQQDEQFVFKKNNDEEQNMSEEIDLNTVRQKEKLKKLNTEGISSQQSAISVMQNSIFYRQFSLVNELVNSQKIPLIFRRMICFRIFLIIISIVGFSLYLYEINLFQYFQEDFKLLSMKNDIFYPILSFQLIRLSIVNYNVELFYKLITQQQFLELLIYPNSKLIGSYEKLKIGISNIVSEPIFFTLYHDQFLNLQFIQKGKLEKLMNLISNAYIEKGQADYESSYFYYNYKNMDTLLNAFNNANALAYDIQQTNLENFQQEIIQEKLKHLLFNQDQSFLNLEIQRLTLLQELIDQDYSQVQNYKLNFQEKDKYFVKMKSLCNKQSKDQMKRKAVIGQYYNIKAIILTLTHFVILALTFSILTTKVHETYSKIKKTGQLYEIFANLNINILSLYQSREVLYYKIALPFLNQTDFDQYYKIAQNGLAGIEQYIDKQWEFQSNNYFFDSDTFSLLIKFSDENLCEELLYIDKSLSICNTTLGGVLQKGFSSALIDIKNQIITEFEDTNFTIRKNYPIQELEGITILSYGLQYLIERFYEDLSSNNYKVEVIYNIITIICLCISLINGLVLLKFDQMILSRKYKLLTKFIYSVPLASILFDDNFLRNTRSYFVNQKLI